MDQLDVNRPSLSGGIIIHGPSVAVNNLIALVKETAPRENVRVIFSTTSSRRLYISAEGVEP